MNEILLRTPRHRVPTFHRAKRLAYMAAGRYLLGGLYTGRICPSWLRFARMEMALPGLPATFEGSKLVQISDVHASPIVRDGYLHEVISHVNEEKPDFVAVTGDLVTGGTAYAKRAANALARLAPSVASLACLGNHDFGIVHPRGHGFMRQLPEFLTRKLEEAGVHVLRNASIVLRRDNQAIQFVGVDDLWSGCYDPAAAFDQADRALPTVALTHNPDAAPELVQRGAHWVLSGHTHGNPYSERRLRNAVFPARHKHLVAGYYAMDNGHLYVNRGLSYARRFNINRRPEISVFTLRRAAE